MLRLHYKQLHFLQKLPTTLFNGVTAMKDLHSNGSKLFSISTVSIALVDDNATMFPVSQCEHLDETSNTEGKNKVPRFWKSKKTARNDFLLLSSILSAWRHQRERESRNKKKEERERENHRKHAAQKYNWAREEKERVKGGSEKGK